MKWVILRAFGRGAQAAPWDNEESIREELFSIERLEQHAESLAAAQPVTARPTTGRSLAVRLRDNESVLLEAYRAIASAVGAGRAITPAAEWLLDNYHLVEGQIREIRDDLPPGYYRQLPKLTTGPFAGYRQVFGVAWAFVADVARRAPRGTGNNRRRDRPERAPKRRCDERDGPQHHHEHAPDLRRRLGGAGRERQSRRRNAALWQRLREYGFSDAQPLPQRDRGAGAGLETDGTGDCASGSSGRKRSGASGTGRRCSSRGARSKWPQARSRLSPDRRGASRVRGDRRISRYLTELDRTI